MNIGVLASFQIKMCVFPDMYLGMELLHHMVALFSDFKGICSARFGSTYTRIGTIQRRLAWPLRKDDTQIREAFHIFKKKQTNKKKKESAYCFP